jgi:uncharacterized protein (DUF885 family)
VVHEAIRSLADQLVATRFQEEPLEAALLGLPDGDVTLGDLSREAEDALLAAYSSLADAATTLRDRLASEGSSLDEIDLVTLDHVRYSAANRVDALGVRGVEFTISDFHNSPLSLLIAVLYQLPLDTEDRKAGHLRRLASMPAYLEGAIERHREGVAVGRVPTARGVRAAASQIDKVLEMSDLSGLRRSFDEADDMFAGDQDRLIESSVRPALEEYRSFLIREARPVGRPDDKPGLCWLPDGDEAYQMLVRSYTSSARTPEDLHATGIAITEHLREEFAEVGTRLWGISDVAEIHSRLRSDEDLRYANSEEILASAIDIVHRAELAAPEWFGVVPSVPCAVEPVPDALADGSAPAYYFTGALDGSRRGTYFVNATKPHERFRHSAEAIAFHEAVPGHHFQLTIAQERKGGHIVFAVFGDTASAEGWGLYAERLADEMGLYSSDLTRLGMLSADAWRAARLVVDTGLHAMGWSRQEAIDWMTSHVPMSQLEITSEVDRYVVMPAQALSYMVGRLELETRRRESVARLGEKFSVRDFHDLVLRTGPVALPALASAVDRWIVGGGGAPQ